MEPDLLYVVAGFTAAWGARIRFLPFRVCPVIFTAAAILIAAGGLL